MTFQTTQSEFVLLTLKCLRSIRFRSRISATMFCSNKRHLGVSLHFLVPFLTASFRHHVVWSHVHYQWNDTTVLFFWARQKWLSEAGKDRWEWAACSRKDMDNVQKSWTWRHFRLWTWFVSSATIKTKLPKASELPVCVSVSWNFHRSASNWVSKLSKALPELCSEPQKPELKFSSLTEVCDRSDRPVTHIKQQTWVKEWEHLGGGKYDESQSQLVSAYATLNNAPFQMVNLLNPRLPLAPHSQHARKAPGREHKDSSRAAMTEERPQQSLLLSMSSADARNVSVLQFEMNFSLNLS